MDIIIRNLLRLVNSDSTEEREPMEPMTEWKWQRLYQLSREFGIEAWVADGMRAYADDFFLNLSPTLRQQILNTPTEKNPESLERFELFVYRASGPFKRFSRESLKAYAHDFIQTVKNIEE
jgi:hypothetical protein